MYLTEQQFVFLRAVDHEVSNYLKAMMTALLALYCMHHFKPRVRSLITTAQPVGATAKVVGGERTTDNM